MMPNAENPENRSSYEQRLQDLLVDFFRHTNIPFLVVEDPHFQKVLHHLNPNIDLPQFTEIFKVATANYTKNANREKQKVRNKLLAKIGKQKGDVVSPTPPPPPAPTVVEVPLEPIVPIPPILSEPPDPSTIENFVDIGIPQQSWPCMICLKMMDWRKTRTMRHNDAPILLLTCVKGGLFSLEVAQKIFKMRTLKCCFDHLKPIFNAALHVFRVNTAAEAYQLSTAQLREPYYLFQKIKEPDYRELCQDPKMGAFKNSLKCFFINYAPRRDDLAHFVGLPPKKRGRQNESSPAVQQSVAFDPSSSSMYPPYEERYDSPPFHCQIIPAKKPPAPPVFPFVPPPAQPYTVEGSTGLPRPGEVDFPEEFLETPETSGSQSGYYYSAPPPPHNDDDYHITHL